MVLGFNLRFTLEQKPKHRKSVKKVKFENLTWVVGDNILWQERC